MDKLQEFEKQFEDWTPRKEVLQSQEIQLTASINPEDLSILNQRLRLLNKQWDEIWHQVTLRKARIEELLSQWGSFDGRHKEMITWIHGMEQKASPSKDFSIEDLLNKLQSVSHCHRRKCEIEVKYVIRSYSENNAVIKFVASV